MWSRYDGAVVRSELEVLARHGLGVTRSFCFWPDFVPEPEVLDETVAGHFEDFLDAHVEAGLGTIPTLVVGHMSGENWDPPWRGGRDLYRDVWLVGQQAWLAQELAARFARHPAVVGWLLSNEMPLYGGTAPADEITAWARILVQALRAGGARQPVSVGDGAWGIEVSGADNGYSLRSLAPLVDFVGPHAYPMQDDEHRQALAAAFACELAGGFGKPVVLEEFGVTSDFAADDLRRRLLPAGPPHDAPRRRDRLARLEQLRLRRPRRRGSLPAPPVRDALRPHRPRGPAEAAAPRDGGVRRAPRGARRRGLRARQGRRGARRARALRAGAALHDPGVPRGPPRGAVPVVRRGARGRPSRRRRPRARRHPCDGAPLPGALHEAPHRPGPRAPAPARGRRRDGLRLVLRGLDDQPARPVDHMARRALRRPAPAALRARGRDRGRRRRARARRGARRARGGHEADVRRRRGAERAELPAGRARPAPRSSPSIATAVRRSCATRSAREAPSSAPIRSSTWRRARRASTRRTRGGCTRRSRRAPGVVRPVSVADPRIVAGAVRHGGSTTSVLVNCSAEPIVAEPVLQRRRASRARAAADRPDGRRRDPRRGAAADLETVPASHEGGDPLGAP